MVLVMPLLQVYVIIIAAGDAFALSIFCDFSFQSNNHYYEYITQQTVALPPPKEGITIKNTHRSSEREGGGRKIILLGILSVSRFL